MFDSADHMVRLYLFLQLLHDTKLMLLNTKYLT